MNEKEIMVTLLADALIEIERLEEQNRWIPVSERLPEKKKGEEYSIWVLVTDGKIFIGAFYNYRTDEWVYSRGTQQLEITHWKPIILPDQALQEQEQCEK